MNVKGRLHTPVLRDARLHEGGIERVRLAHRAVERRRELRALARRAGARRREGVHLLVALLGLGERRLRRLRARDAQLELGLDLLDLLCELSQIV